MKTKMKFKNALIIALAATTVFSSCTKDDKKEVAKPKKDKNNYSKKK